MDKRALNREIKRLKDLLDRAEVPKQEQDALQPTIENIAWLRLKLDEAREEMLNESIITEYDNGGEQKGTHRNPLIGAYTELWKAYNLGLKTYLSYLPKDLQEEAPAKKEDVLSKVIKMKKAAKA